MAVFSNSTPAPAVQPGLLRGGDTTPCTVLTEAEMIALLDALDASGEDLEDEGEDEPWLGWGDRGPTTTISTDDREADDDGEPTFGAPERHPGIFNQFGGRYVDTSHDARQTDWAAGSREHGEAEEVNEDGGDILDEPWWERLAHPQLGREPMSDRRTILRGLAALPFAGAAAPALASPTDPFPGFHREILVLQTAINSADSDVASDPMMARWGEIDRLAMATRPTSLADAAGCLDYARREIVQFKMNEGKAVDDPSNRLILSLIDGALGVLRQAGGAA